MTDEGINDMTQGFLQVAGVLIQDDKPVFSWGVLRTATEAEAAFVVKHPVFWRDPIEGGHYHRAYPKRMSHQLCRVVTAAQVLGAGQLRIQTDPPNRTASVVITGPDLSPLIPARSFELTVRPRIAYLTNEMRDVAGDFARAYGYKLGGVWLHTTDGSHRIDAVPA